MHLEQIKKHEHNLQQQKMMLEDVQTRLEALKDEVQKVLPNQRKRKVLVKLKGTLPSSNC